MLPGVFADSHLGLFATHGSVHLEIVCHSGLREKFRHLRRLAPLLDAPPYKIVNNGSRPAVFCPIPDTGTDSRLHDYVD